MSNTFKITMHEPVYIRTAISALAGTRLEQKGDEFFWL